MPQPSQPITSSPEPPGKRRRLSRHLARLGVLAIISFLMLRWFEHSQVFRPSRNFDALPGSTGLDWAEANFTATDGVKLNGWFFPAATNSPRGELAFLICHGNGGNISHRLGLVKSLHRLGAAVLVFDYRGYGRSEGSPGETGTYLDAQAAHAWLVARGFAPSSVILLGESLGGGVASELVLRERTGGLVLQCTFTSIPDIGRELFPWLPVRTLSTIRYDTLARLPRVTVPVLVLHSRADTLIRFHHAERNFAAAREPKSFAEVAGDHSDAIWEQPAYTRAMEQFLTELVALRKPPAK